MSFTPITKDQWKSVARNSVFTFLSVFFVTLQVQGALDKKALLAAASAAGMAALKIVEKSLTDVK